MCVCMEKKKKQEYQLLLFLISYRDYHRSINTMSSSFFVNSSIFLFQEKERKSQSACKMPLVLLKTHGGDLASMELSLEASQLAISTLWAPKKVKD